MITIKNKAALQKMCKAGELLAGVFKELQFDLKEGVSTLYLNNLIEKMLIKQNMISQTKGYKGYKHASCISVNDEVVHGVPSEKNVLKKGDLVKIDICAAWNGYCADATRCFFIGDAIPAEIQRFINAAKEALSAGIAQAVPSKRLSDISAAIQQKIESYGYGIVRGFAGHGIGKRMHEEPEILNYGNPGKGPLLMPGMTFALEPMITMGDEDVYIDSDGWTVRTKDKSLAAHVEDTILITHDGPVILTKSI